MKYIADKILAYVCLCFSGLFLAYSFINICFCNTFLKPEVIMQMYEIHKRPDVNNKGDLLIGNASADQEFKSPVYDLHHDNESIQQNVQMEIAQSEGREQQILRQSSSRGIVSKESSDAFAIPVYGKITSRFGMRDGRLHQGLDIGANTGENIYAVQDGTVVFTGVQGGYGKLIKIQHKDGIMTLYAHCNKILVTNGQRITKGQIIGLVGDSGNSRGSHLHLEVLKDGVPQNPEDYFNQAVLD